MKFSKEARIGLLVASAILIFFAGFYFLKGANIFSGENEYFVYYDNVQGLQPSSPVQVKGMSVGRVSAISLNGGGRVKVTIAVNKKYKIPQETVASLTSVDLLGTKAISLQLGNSTAIAEDESTLKSNIEGGIIDALSVEITPLLRDMRHAVGTLDSVLVSVNGVLDVSSRENLRSSIANLDATMANFSQLSSRLNAESAQLQGVIRNANSITSNLADNNERITRIINNAATVTDQLSEAQIDKTMKEFQTAASNLTAVLNKVNSKEGSLGLLVNDPHMYNNLNASLSTLNSLMGDIQAHPTRYINLTIFGRKK
ncbi:MAG TPA: MlaD family protein [Flavipsychrobacter sp.]|nr:MlaD family protein [Flavipsychrobacter sp.]